MKKNLIRLVPYLIIIAICLMIVAFEKTSSPCKAEEWDGTKAGEFKKDLREYIIWAPLTREFQG